MGNNFDKMILKFYTIEKYTSYIEIKYCEKSKQFTFYLRYIKTLFFDNVNIGNKQLMIAQPVA